MGSRIWNRCVARLSSAVKGASSRFESLAFMYVRLRRGGRSLNSAEVPIFYLQIWYGGTRLPGQLKHYEEKEISQGGNVLDGSVLRGPKIRSAYLGQSRQGRNNVAQRGSGGEGDETRRLSPVGAVQCRSCAVLRGSLEYAAAYPPLSRWATLCRPFGTPEDIEPRKIRPAQSHCG
jgi:hypothetical protein